VKILFRTHRLKIIFVLGILFYLTLMFLLFSAEHNSPKGNIHSLSQAIWYSIVTVTTVGYGDHYPVTAWGKFFGGFLVLGSLGLTGYVL
jgi:voltage-gated potassium channel